MEEKWIYKSVAFSFANLSKMDEKLSEYGQKGWEAVGVSTASNMAGIASQYIVLLKKRHIQGVSGDNEAGLRLQQLLDEARNGKAK